MITTMLAFSCPSCRQPVLIHESWSGQPAGCPHCGNRFVLPSILPGAPSGRVEAAQPAPATDWSKVTGAMVPQAPIFPVDWENAYRGLAWVQGACFLFLGTTVAWYVAWMVNLEPPGVVWKPIAAVKVLVYTGLGLGLTTFVLGLSRCTRVPPESPLRGLVRRSWIFTQVSLGFFLLATGDMAMGANPILPPEVFFGLLVAGVLTALFAHVCFIRFLQGIAGTFSIRPGRAAGLYQLFLALIVFVHIMGMIFLGKANQQGLPIGMDLPVSQLRILAAACGPGYPGRRYRKYIWRSEIALYRGSTPFSFCVFGCRKLCSR